MPASLFLRRRHGESNPAFLNKRTHFSGFQSALLIKIECPCPANALAERRRTSVDIYVSFLLLER